MVTDSPPAFFGDENAQEVRKLPRGIVHTHDGAAVENLVGARTRDGEHVFEYVGLRGEETGVDTECGVVVSYED